MKRLIAALLCIAMVAALSLPVLAAEATPANKFDQMTDEEIWMFVLIVIGVGAAIGLITILVMRSGMKTAVFQRGAREYIDHGTYQLHTCRDIYLYSNTTRVRRNTDND